MTKKVGRSLDSVNDSWSDEQLLIFLREMPLPELRKFGSQARRERRERDYNLAMQVWQDHWKERKTTKEKPAQ
jgi:hypothetical protein